MQRKLEIWLPGDGRDQKYCPYDCGLVPSSLGETEGLIASSSKGGVGAGINLSHCLELQHVVELRAQVEGRVIGSHTTRPAGSVTR